MEDPNQGVIHAKANVSGPIVLSQDSAGTLETAARRATSSVRLGEATALRSFSLIDKNYASTHCVRIYGRP